MQSKIITLPISSGAGTSPISRFQADMENLLDTAVYTLQDDLFIGTLEDDVSAENWERYTKIVRGIWSPSSISINLFLDTATVQVSQSQHTTTAHSQILQG